MTREKTLFDKAQNNPAKNFYLRDYWKLVTISKKNCVEKPKVVEIFNMLAFDT